MKIIAIDPGYERMGVAILEKNSGNPPTQIRSGVAREVIIFSECFKTSAKIPHAERLNLIGGEIEKVIKKFKPEALAIETLFFSTNRKTAMAVSEARGVMLYVAAHNGLEIKEFQPNQIKVAVTGYGGSDKTAVIKMVDKLIQVSKKIQYDDEYDAIAVGLTYFATHSQRK